MAHLARFNTNGPLPWIWSLMHFALSQRNRPYSGSFRSLREPVRPSNRMSSVSKVSIPLSRITSSPSCRPSSPVSFWVRDWISKLETSSKVTISPGSTDSETAYGLGARSPTFAPLLGDGIFTQEAAPWKHSRDMLRPLFSLNRANIFTQVEEHTEYLVNCIPTGEYVDLQTLFFRFTFDTTTFLLFGKSMNSLQATFNRDDSNAGEARFSEAFRVSQDFLFRRGRLGDLYWLIGGKEFRRQCSIVHEFIDEAVQEALSAEYQKDKAADVHSFLDALIQQTRDPKVLRDQLLNVMLAGRDTTACCLTWTL